MGLRVSKNLRLKFVSCFNSFFKRYKCTNVDRFFIQHNSCNPSFFLFVPSYSRNTTNVCFVWCSILRILKPINFSKIAYSVVVSFPIYMVNLIYRPFTISNKPCQSMSKIHFFLELNSYVSIRFLASCFCANFYFSSRRFNPNKFSRIRVVLKTLLQQCKIYFAHAVAPLCNGLRSNGSVLTHRAVAPL